MENEKEVITDTEETKEETKEELQERIMNDFKLASEKLKESNEAVASGCGRLKLEVPIKSGNGEVTELAYDFTKLTGLEYTEAMDQDANAVYAYKITYRQALSLFARAAAKQTPGLDMRDISERIDIRDALEGVQLATLFFNASTQAGRLRISKR